MNPGEQLKALQAHLARAIAERDIALAKYKDGGLQQLKEQGVDIAPLEEFHQSLIDEYEVNAANHIAFLQGEIGRLEAEIRAGGDPVQQFNLGLETLKEIARADWTQAVGNDDHFEAMWPAIKLQLLTNRMFQELGVSPETPDQEER